MSHTISIRPAADLYNRALRWAGVESVTVHENGNALGMTTAVAGVGGTRDALNDAVNALLNVFVEETAGRWAPGMDRYPIRSQLLEAQRQLLVYRLRDSGCSEEYIARRLEEDFPS